MATEIFTDTFPGSSLDPDKWDINIIGVTNYTVADNKLSINDCNENTWCFDYLTDKGNQIQAKIEELPENYTVTFRIKAINTEYSGIASNEIALTDNDGNRIIAIGYVDYEGGTTQNRRYCIAENNFDYKNPIWDQETDDNKIIKPVSTEDYMDVTINKTGNVITISTVEDGEIGHFTFTTTPTKIAIVTSRYSTYPFIGTTEISNFIVTDLADIQIINRVRAKLAVMEGIVTRARSILWIEPERTRARIKLKIIEEVKKQVRIKLKIKIANPKYTQVKEHVRVKLNYTELQRTRARCKLKVNTGETRIELFAQVVLREEEFNTENPETEFIVGDTRYDS